MREAHIKVWMLTGDKLETAKNIGFACKLLSPDMHIWEVHDEQSALELFTPEIFNENNKLRAEHKKWAIVIEALALRGILKQKEIFV